MGARLGLVCVMALGGVAATFACTGDDPDLAVADPDAGATSSSTSGSSGTPAGDATVDAPPRCDPNKPFANPQPVPGINTADAEVSATFSGDELIVYLARRPTGAQKEQDLYVASRTSTSEPFSEPKALTSVNTPDIDDNVSTPSDGLTIYFHSSRPDAGPNGGFEDIWRATRPTRTSGVLPAEPVTSVNSPTNDQDPYITADGNTLYFSSTRDEEPDSGNSYSFRIFRADKLGDAGDFSTPIPLELEYEAGVTQLSQPVVSANGKTLFIAFRANMNATPTIWSAHRDNPAGAFRDFGPLPGGAFSAGRNLPTWISPDGCHLYFRSDRPGSVGDEDIWMASRPL